MMPPDASSRDHRTVPLSWLVHGVTHFPNITYSIEFI